MKLIIVAILSLLSLSVGAFYDSNSGVVTLTPNNFDHRVIDGDEVWIVEFFAPWCGHCQSFVPEYTKAAKALKGVVRVGAVDAAEHQSLGSQYGVKGFPTIKIFGANKKSPIDFNAARTAQALIDAGFKALRDKVSVQSGQKYAGGGSQDSGSGDGKDVVELTDSNFEEKVLRSDDIWLVEFYAPWCGHCKNLAPHWASAAAELKGKVRLGALDATVHTVMSNRYGVRGYPSIKYFPSGKKGDAEEYNGGRTSSDIVQWALDQLAQNIQPPEVHEIVDQDVLKEGCETHQICIVAVLPHILDCQSQCRNDYLKTLTKLGEKYKKNMWGWLWMQGGTQMELEDSLGIGGFGYPALAAANVRKMKYSWLRGSFSYDGINEFLRELAVGRGSTAPLKGAALPKVQETDPWDGKDGKLDVEEDDDTSDVDTDDLEKKTEL